jgi:hypothetical protein
MIQDLHFQMLDDLGLRLDQNSKARGCASCSKTF